MYDFNRFLEGVGIFLLIPLIGLTGVMDIKTDEVPFLSWVNELFLGIPETLSLILILGVYVILMVGQSVFKRNQTILGVKIQQGFVRQLRDEAYGSLLQVNWGFT